MRLLLDPFVLGIKLLELRRTHAMRCGAGPDQFCIGCVFLEQLQELGKRGAVIVLGVGPAVQAVVEMDDGKLVLLQHQREFLEQGRIAQPARAGEARDIRPALQLIDHSREIAARDGVAH